MTPNLPAPQQPSDSHELSRESEMARYNERPPVGGADESGLNVRRAISALWRFKWLVLGVTILGTGIGKVLSRGQQPVFQAGTSVWIDQGAERGPLRGPGLADPEAWVDLATSFAVLDTVVHDLHLNVSIVPSLGAKADSLFRLADRFSPGSYRIRVDSATNKYTLTRADGVAIESGSVGDSIGTRLGFKWAPTAEAFASSHDVQISVGSVRGAAAGWKQRLNVSIDQAGFVLKIELQDTDPVRLANVLNAVTRRFAVVATNLKKQKMTELTRVLSAQVSNAQKWMNDAEQAYKAYQVRTITLPDRAVPRAGARGGAAETAVADPLFSDYFEMQVEQSQIRQERTQIQQVLATPADSELPLAALERIRAAQQSSSLAAALQEVTKKRADLRALRYTYSEIHPEVQKLQGQLATLEHTTVPQLLKEVDGQLAARGALLDRQIAAKGDNLREIPQRSIEGVRLQRDWSIAENTYTALQTSLQQTQVAEASSGVSDVRALDMAVAPTSPVKDTAQRLMLMAFLGSLGLGSAGALLLDRMDSRFRYPDQVSQDLGLTILGAVPHKKGKTDVMDRGADDAPLLEALRAIRLNLVYAYGTAGPMVFTVTSPGRAEGKTFLTAQLARVFADNGQRTLVVEGDLRKGVLHRRLAVSRRPGLSDYLRGDAAVDQIVQKTKFPQLHVITGGTRFRDAPELLGTQAMVQLLAALRSRYDVIICDSPPLGAGIDPLVLGTATGNLLLLLRTGVSHRELTEAKLEVISRMPIRLLGAVLNDVPKDVVFSYYSYYLPGYETSDEGKLALPATK
jgi:capsular exopolysaccharide synthesis family protein